MKLLPQRGPAGRRKARNWGVELPRASGHACTRQKAAAVARPPGIRGSCLQGVSIDTYVQVWDVPPPFFGPPLSIRGARSSRARVPGRRGGAAAAASDVGLISWGCTLISCPLASRQLAPWPPYFPSNFRRISVA